MKKFTFISSFCFYLLTACIPIPSTQTTTDTNLFAHKVFKTENQVYEPNIRTVLLYSESASDTKKSQLNPPVIYLGQSQPFVLEFDELYQGIDNYRVKIFHCNLNWQTSQLNDIEFLNDYNDFPIRDYRLSFNTKVPYTHYRFVLPKVKISGNYILMVYRDGNEKDLILTQRFLVYENKISIQPSVKFSSNSSEREKNQQIEFNITYNSYTLNNPRDEIKVIIRQNYRWDNAIYDLKPLYIREFEKKLEYTHFNLENNFKGSNEFRRFDFRSLRFLGFNVAGINLKDSINAVQIAVDKSRETQPYFVQPDYNGGFIVSHYETGGGSVESDYAKVFFTLKAKEQANADVYVLGNFNNWRFSEENRLTYIAEQEAYIGRFLLKQGEYNYLYGIKRPEDKQIDTAFFEGSHQATENIYEIIIYHRPLGSRADLIIGYKVFKSPDGREP